MNAHAYVEEAIHSLPNADASLLSDSDLGPPTIGGLQTAYTASRGQSGRARGAERLFVRFERAIDSSNISGQGFGLYTREKS